MFVEISFNLPMDSVWTYSVPLELQNDIIIGSKVLCSFKNEKNKLGVVVNITKNIPTFNVKTISSIVQDNITLPSYIFYMRDRISEYYACTLNEALHLFVFPTKRKKPLELVQKNNKVIEVSQLLFKLSSDQQTILESILEESKNLHKYFIALIHGITGSGKTEVYQALIQKTILQGKQTLLLLPEITITTQIHQRFLKVFPKDLVVFIHSKMSQKEKELALQKISSGSTKIIIGPRSALFSPFNNLGCIIMDEEHDFSYKSQQSPRYHTKRVAVQLAKYLNIPFIMGSATPSLETYHATQQNNIKLYTLTKRFFNTPLPSITVVDLSKENHFFSPPLVQKIVGTYKKQKQSILFLNRRGFSPVLLCVSCQYIFYCPDCSISLTYHKKTGLLQCHYCGFKEPKPDICPNCKEKNNLKTRGIGTERIEEEIKELFHNYRILRMDKDSIKNKNSYNEIIESFEGGHADILVGTQMIAKGLDFPNVELVGILSCDIILNLPDFRSSEHLFTLVAQVSGRSGRKTQGEVVLQTRFPNHYAVKAAIEHDYSSFYKQEIELRKEYNYPPFCKFIRIIVRSEESEKGFKIIKILLEELKKIYPEIDIIGPSACVLEKLYQQFRFHIIIRTKEPMRYSNYIKQLLKTYNNRPGYHIECDVDPITLL